MLDQAVGVFAHFKEVCFLGSLHDRTSAFRALAVHKLRLRPEALIRRAVPPFIGALVDIALLVHLPEHLLDLFFVIRVCRTDKLIIRCVHQVPDPFDLGSRFIDVFLWRHSGFRCFIFNFLPVFIGSCLEKHVIALHSAETGYAVRQDDLVRVADMRFPRCIGNSCGQIIGVFSFLHGTLLFQI